MNKLYIITGPAGVGKSTISEKIAETLEKSVMIEGDTVYNFFVGGRVSPWLDDAPLDLFWKNSFLLINSYLENGYDVVFNYIIKPEEFEEIKSKFNNYEIIFRVLIVDEDTIIRRDKKRPVDCQMGKRSLVLLKEFIDAKYSEEYIIDSSKLTIEQTVNKVIS